MAVHSVPVSRHRIKPSQPDGTANDEDEPPRIIDFSTGDKR